MEKKKNILGLIGFIISIVSIFTLGLISFVSLILSVLGLVYAPNYDNDKKELSIAGIVISSVMIIILFALIAFGSETTESSSPNTNAQQKVEEIEKVKVNIVDFSNMTREEIQTWCNNNKINCKFYDEYSDSIENGKMITQSSQAGTTLYEGETLTLTYSKGPKPSLSKLNALGKAQAYLNSMPFSYNGLIKQLEFEKYPHEDAVWAVDRCGADWNEQAVKKAKAYLDTLNFSHDGLVKQLEFEGFTHEQAEYGVSQNGL